MWVVHMLEYYDYVLGFVPLALVGFTAVLVAVGAEPLVAISVGAATAGLVVGHALFVNVPVAPAESASDHPPVNAD